MLVLFTANIEIFTQYIYFRAFRAVSSFGARKFNVSENYYRNRTNGIDWYVRENLSTQICLLVLGARKSSCAKISTFTVVLVLFCFDYVSYSCYSYVLILCLFVNVLCVSLI